MPFASLALTCPNCSADMRIIAFVIEAAPIERMRNHIGEPPPETPSLPSRAPGRMIPS